MANNGRPPQPHSSDGRRPRILRIGILLGGKIVEERLIRERVAVTIGQSMRNTFSIPIDAALSSVVPCHSLAPACHARISSGTSW